MAALAALAHYDDQSSEEESNEGQRQRATTTAVHADALAASGVPSSGPSEPRPRKKKRRTNPRDDAVGASEASAPAPASSQPRKRSKSSALTAAAAAPPPSASRLPAPNFGAASLGGRSSLRSDDCSFHAAPGGALLAPAPLRQADPSAHGGRVRSFAHVEGQWATHVFLPLRFRNGGAQEADGAGPTCPCAAATAAPAVCPRSLAALEALASRAERDVQGQLDGRSKTAGHTPTSRPALASSPSAPSSSLPTAAATAAAASPWTRFRPASLSFSPSQSLVTASGSAAAASSSFHVSLSRTVVLRHHQIDAFMSEMSAALRDLLQRSADSSQLHIRGPPVELLLRDWKLYWNDERTRCFCALLVWPTSADGGSDAQTDSVTDRATAAPCPSPCCARLSAGRARSSHALLLALIARVDQVLLSFGLPAYYSPPELHATVSWKLPPQPSQPSLTETRQDQQHLFSPAAAPDAAMPVTPAAPNGPSLPPLFAVCECDRVQVSVGNRLYTLPFEPSAPNKP